MVPLRREYYRRSGSPRKTTLSPLPLAESPGGGGELHVNALGHELPGGASVPIDGLARQERVPREDKKINIVPFSKLD